MRHTLTSMHAKWGESMLHKNVHDLSLHMQNTRACTVLCEWGRVVTWHDTTALTYNEFLRGIPSCVTTGLFISSTWASTDTLHTPVQVSPLTQMRARIAPKTKGNIAPNRQISQRNPTEMKRMQTDKGNLCIAQHCCLFLSSYWCAFQQENKCPEKESSKSSQAKPVWKLVNCKLKVY